MSASAESPLAWEPFTPRGVSVLARARLSRLLLVQFVVAALAALAVVWFLYDACFPTIRDAIRNLPDAGAIRSGRLDWAGDAPRLLAAGRFLAFIVDPAHTGQIQPPADVQVEFGRQTVRVISLFGHAEWHYPSDWIIAFNRLELQPLWGAWEPEWPGLVLPAVVGALVGVWALLATIYFLPVRLIGFLLRRDMDFRSSWKLAGAALMPGALLFALAIVLYDFGALNLISFGVGFGLHLVLGWGYVLVSPFFMPRRAPVATAGNPFSTAVTRPEIRLPLPPENPFASRPEGLDEE